MNKINPVEPRLSAMKHSTIRIYITLVAMIFLTDTGFASTIGIATGNRTADGRPLLFKNKDRTDNYPSDVNFYQGGGGEYDYVYQVNDGQNHTRARMGINSAGFGIVYSTSENLDGAGNGPSASQLTATALKTCRIIDDFRQLLDQTNGARIVHEHFAVIDSTGSGSLFEVDGYSYIEIVIADSIGTMANTAKYHPSAGPPASGSTSPDREARASYLMTHPDTLQLDYQYFVQEIIQDFSNSQEDEDQMPQGQYLTNAVLSRYKTACGGVIRGCLADDDPRIESMMWLALSEPSLSIVLPFSPNVDEVFEFIRPDSPGDGMAGACDRMRQFVYDYSEGRYADRYANTDQLMRIREYTFPIEDSIFISYEKRLPGWRSAGSASSQNSMVGWAYAMQSWAKQEYENIINILALPGSEKPVIHAFNVIQNYPNPFNSGTRIDFVLNSAGKVIFTIFDLAGRKITHKILGPLPAGHHSLLFSPDQSVKQSFAAGVYFYRITFNQKSVIKKMIYLP